MSLGTPDDRDKVLLWEACSIWRKIYVYKSALVHSFLYEPVYACTYTNRSHPYYRTALVKTFLNWYERWEHCPCSCSTQKGQYDLSGTILALLLGTTTTLVSMDLHKTLSLSPDHWHDRPKQLQSIVSMCTSGVLNPWIIGIRCCKISVGDVMV